MRPDNKWLLVLLKCNHVIKWYFSLIRIMDENIENTNSFIFFCAKFLFLPEIYFFYTSTLKNKFMRVPREKNVVLNKNRQLIVSLPTRDKHFDRTKVLSWFSTKYTLSQTELNSKSFKSNRIQLKFFWSFRSLISSVLALILIQKRPNRTKLIKQIEKVKRSWRVNK